MMTTLSALTTNHVQEFIETSFDDLRKLGPSAVLHLVAPEFRDHLSFLLSDSADVDFEVVPHSIRRHTASEWQFAVQRTLTASIAVAGSPSGVWRIHLLSDQAAFNSQQILLNVPSRIDCLQSLCHDCLQTPRAVRRLVVIDATSKEQIPFPVIAGFARHPRRLRRIKSFVSSQSSDRIGVLSITGYEPQLMLTIRYGPPWRLVSIRGIRFRTALSEHQ